VDYWEAAQAGLQQSLEAGVYAYLDFVVAHQVELGWKLHPLLLAAHWEMRQERRGTGEVSECGGATSL
jgi:hypothetical protein